MRPMRRFLASGWYPFLVVLAFAGTTAGMVAVIDPAATSDTGNGTIVRYASVAAWAVGPVLALLSLLLMGMLNGIRRLFKARGAAWLHPVVVLLGLSPWLAFGWQLTMNEPRHTPIARAVIDFAGREMLAGALAASLLTVLLAVPLLLPKRR